jgi:hypothetical protein
MKHELKEFLIADRPPLFRPQFIECCGKPEPIGRLPLRPRPAAMFLLDHLEQGEIIEPVTFTFAERNERFRIVEAVIRFFEDPVFFSDDLPIVDRGVRKRGKSAEFLTGQQSEIKEP